MSNFFNTRGPIRPQIMMVNQNSGQSQPNQKAVIPQAIDFIRSDLSPMEMANLSGQQRHQSKIPPQMHMDSEDDQYGDEEGGNDLPAGFDEESYLELYEMLKVEGRGNREFLKVLDILDRDAELRPLMIEHESLLLCLKDVPNIKAENMLSILTAAETEMYESSRQKEELQVRYNQTQRELDLVSRRPQTESREVSVNLIEESKHQDFESRIQTANFEIEKLKKELFKMEKENTGLSHELLKEKDLRENLEREKECTFKNLYDENQMLKRHNETLKKNETDTKKAIEQKEKEFHDEIENLRARLKTQEDLRISMLQNKSKLEVDIQKNQQFIDNLEKEIQLLEKENDNLHRKMNITYNSVLFQSHLNHNYLQSVKEGDQQNQTPARRNLSSSFQHSEFFDNQASRVIGQPAFGHSTQKLKLLMSENSKSQGGQSLIAHSIYYGLGQLGGNRRRDSQPNIYFQRGESLVRSNSIEVILLDEEESRKQNNYPLGEEEKQPSNASGILTNKQSWLKTKGLFTDLSPINSIASHQMDHSTSRQNQQRLKKLQEVEEEQTEILGTNPNTITYNNAKYYEDQYRKLQSEVEKLREENKELTQKLNNTSNQFFIQKTESSPYKPTSPDRVYTTPQNYNGSSQFAQNFGLNQPDFNRNIGNQNTPMNVLYSNEQSPMMMATFSNQKDRQFNSHYNIGGEHQHFSSHQSSLPKTSEQERNRILEQYNEKIQNEFYSKLQEIGTRLIGVMKRFGPHQNEIHHYISQEFTIPLIKELIADIMNKVDILLEMHHTRSRSGGLLSQVQTGFGPGSYSGGGIINNSSQIGSTTMDQTPIDLKNLFLEEKERRLLVLEELNKTKEDLLLYKNEHEKLKIELLNEKQHNQTMVMSQLNQQTQDFDQLQRTVANLQCKCDQYQDENVTLKLKLAELEGDLFEERQKQAIKYDYSLDILKNKMTGDVMDYKLKYEQELMTFKQDKLKQQMEIQTYIERISFLKDDINILKARIIELEKENISHSKENYILQNELDYESLRASQLQTKKDSGKQTVILQLQQERLKYEELVAKLEARIKDLIIESGQWETKYKNLEDRQQLQRMQFEQEVYLLRSDNTKLIDQFKLKSDQGRNQDESLKQDNNRLSQMIKQQEKKLAALKIKHLINLKDLKKQFKSFLRLFRLQKIGSTQDKRALGDSNMSFNNPLNESNQTVTQQIAHLEQQIIASQTIIGQLCSVIATILRQVNLNQPIRLKLQGIVQKGSVGAILPGLKQNTQVVELNLNQCGLDDEDIGQVSELLKYDQGITSLKLAHNSFTSFHYLINILQQKKMTLRTLDLSGFKLSSETLDQLPNIIQQLQVLEELFLYEIIDKNLSLKKDKVNYLIRTIASCQRLKALDFSKNKLSSDSKIFLFNSLKTMPQLQFLSLCSIGLSDEQSKPFLQMIQSLKQLRKLSISGNYELSPMWLEQLIQTLKSQDTIEDLDLSKCQINTQSCLQILANLIISNKKLRFLNLSKTGIQDVNAYYLIQPISESLSLETLKLDYNQLGPTFIDKLCKRIVQNKLKDSRGVGNFNQADGSFNYDSDTSMSALGIDDRSSFNQISRHSHSRDSKNLGLVAISLEGNKIGDAGAKAIAELIKTPNENTKQLRSVNLNECQLTMVGFEALKTALQERGAIAHRLNLTHVKVSVERNNFN